MVTGVREVHRSPQCLPRGLMFPASWRMAVMSLLQIA